MPKNILIISPVPTHPTTAGNRARIATLISNISSLGHNVYFMYISYDQGDLSTMKKFWGDHFFHVPYKRTIKKYNRRVRTLKKIILY